MFVNFDAQMSSRSERPVYCRRKNPKTSSAARTVSGKVEKQWFKYYKIPIAEKLMVLWYWNHCLNKLNIVSMRSYNVAHYRHRVRYPWWVLQINVSCFWGTGDNGASPLNIWCFMMVQNTLTVQVPDIGQNAGEQISTSQLGNHREFSQQDLWWNSWCEKVVVSLEVRVKPFLALQCWMFDPWLIKPVDKHWVFVC